MCFSFIPRRKNKFMGRGKRREAALVMHNDFIIVGPAADPATVKMSNPLRPLSRRSLLPMPSSCPGRQFGHACQREASGRRRYQAGRAAVVSADRLGMGQTLNVAAEKKAYILLTGDLLALKKNLNLVILNEGTPCC